MLLVREIMTSEIKTISPEKTIRDAAKAMTRFRIGSLVVVDGDRPMGIITEGDVSRATGKGIDPNKTAVRTIMAGHLITTTLDERVESAAKLMAEANIKKLLVVDEGKLVGMVTQTDIVASSFDLVTSLKELVRARYRPPDFQP